jgi:hypothetical protein
MKKVLHGRTFLLRDNEVMSNEALSWGGLRHPIVDDSEKIDEAPPPVSQALVLMIIVATLTIFLTAGYLLWTKTQ